MASSEKGAAVHTKHLTMFLGRKSIIHLAGKEWKHHRYLMTKTFNSVTSENFEQPVREATTVIAQALKDRIASYGNEYHMNGDDLSAALVPHVVGKVFFGFDLGGALLERDDLSALYNTLVDDFDRRMKAPFDPFARFYCIPTPANIKYKRGHRLAREMFIKTLNKHRPTKSSTPAWKNRSDFLMAILAFVEGQGYSSDDEEIIDMMVSAYLFSLESMTTTIQYMLYCSAKNPAVEQKCLDEINGALKEDGTLNVDDLTYCHAFITEVLRLYPLLPFSWRQLETELTLGETTIPAGMKVYVSNWYLNRDERSFPRPLEVLPERWVERTATGTWDLRSSKDAMPMKSISIPIGKVAVPLKSSATSIPALKASITSVDCEQFYDSDSDSEDGFDDDYAVDDCCGKQASMTSNPEFVPAGDRKNLFSFGKGGRNCPGVNIARKEACIFFSELIRHFKFEVEEGYKIHPNTKGINQKPLDGVPFIISRR